MIVVTRPGGYERLRMLEADDPLPGPGQVLLAVTASGVNFADVAVRLGVYDGVRDYPVCPGFEVAGTVVTVGDGVRHVGPGDAVFGAVRFGGYADRVVADAKLVWRLPPGFTAAQSAALPVNYATAWHALFGLGQARPGARVLIHSAAGGVGLAAAQLCRLGQLDAIGLVGKPEKIETALRYGCREVLDARAPELWRRVAALGPFDLVLDASGGPGLRRGLDVLAPMGRLVVYGFATMLPRGRGRLNWPALLWRWLRTPRIDPFGLVMKNRSAMGFNLVHLFHSDRLKDELGGAILDVATTAGFLQPPIAAIPAADCAEAHRRLASGDTVGKLVLTW